VGNRVLIADDHAVLRDGIRALLASAGDLDVVGEAADGRAAIDLAVKLEPDLVLMDVAMPGLGGLEATLEIRKRLPEIKILVLTQYGEAEYVRRFLAAGVSGYVLKKAAGADLIGAIRAVLRGGLVLDPDVARTALGDGAPAAAGGYDSLTDREKQVLKLVAEGRTNKEVAAMLDISVKTAMSHREHLMEKLGLHNRSDLVRFAIHHSVIS
jgi:two-component system, NarL family, response regulator NreC